MNPVRDLAFVNVNVIDGTGAEPQERRTVVVREGRIAGVTDDRGSATGDLPTIDGSGHALIPGLIDCHVHLATSGSADNDWQGEDGVFAGLRAARDAYRCLAAGFTTLRDCGGRDFMEMSVRDAIRRRVIRGPRLVLAGKIVSMTTPGCLWFPGMYREADGADEVRKAAREQLKMGADLVKVMATAAAFAPDEDPESVQYGLEELRAACDEAHNQRRRVAAHAEGIDGIRNAVLAGVDTIEHGACLHQDEQVMHTMKAQANTLVPTLKVYEAVVSHPELDLPESIRRDASRMHAASVTTFARAAELGVPIAAGTDAATPFNLHGENAGELALMVRHGMSPVDAIHAATQAAARALRLDDEIGCISEGRRADLVLVAGDPATDISVLEDQRRIAVVMQEGEIVVDRRADAERMPEPELHELMRLA